MIPIRDDIPTRRFPILTVAIIVLNVLVYFGFQHGGLSLGATGDKRVVEYGAIPYELTHPGKKCGAAQTPAGQIVPICEGERGVPQGLATRAAQDTPSTWVTVFTAMFMHGGLLHLAGNMLFLWIFGNNVEDSMSRPRFVVFYLLGGIAALAGQTAIGPNAAVPTVGASGAIAAVLAGYLLLYPRARVVTLIIIIFFITIIELPALLVLGAWFLLQVAYGVSDIAQPVGGGGGVAYFAHIGGFLFGLATIKLFANRVHADYDRQHRLPVY
jgi:membrane associated rhomboid family serine protease